MRAAEKKPADSILRPFGIDFLVLCYVVATIWLGVRLDFHPAMLLVGIFTGILILGLLLIYGWARNLALYLHSALALVGLYWTFREASGLVLLAINMLAFIYLMFPGVRKAYHRPVVSPD